MLKNATALPLLSGFALLATSGVASAQDAPKSVALTPLQPAQVIVKEEPAPLSPLATDPELIQGHLENGVRYLIRPTTEPKGRVSVRLYVEAGSLDEKEETKGLSHFLEHLVFNGSRHYERGELIPIMQKMGIGFGGDTNAYTSFRQTVYMMDLPNLDEETVNFVMTVMRDFADGATLTDEAIDKERGIIVSELKARDSASYRAQIQMIEQLTAGTRLVPYMPIGLESVITGAPYEAFRTIYRERYTADRMTVIVTGDVSPATAESWVKQYFADMPATKGAPRGEVGSPETAPTSRIIPNAESALTSLSITMVEPFELKADTIEQRIADFPLQLACKMLNNRLNRLSRQEDSPFISARVSKEDLLGTSSIFSIIGHAKPENAEAALAQIEQELRRACRYGFQEVEFQEAIDGMGVAYQSSIDTWSSTSAADMAKILVNAKSDNEAMTAPSEDMRAFIEGVKAVMSNPAQCQEMLAAEYNPDKAMLTATGSIPEGMSEEKLTEIYQASLKQEVEAPAKMEQVKFAYSDIGPAGQITKQTYLEDIGVTTLTLSNGIRVNLKPIDFKKGSISVNAQVDGGALALPNQFGLKSFIGATMVQGGLEAHSYEELQRLFAGNKVGMNMAVGTDRFSFTGTTNKADLELQCQLLAAMIQHAGYREESERMYRQVIPTIFQRMTTTPAGAYALLGMRKMFGDDIRFVLPTQEQLESCSMADVKAAMEPLLKDGAMEVSIVGDFDVAEVLPILERSFGAMPARQAEFKEMTDAQRTVNLAPAGWERRDFIDVDSDLDKTLVINYASAGDGRDKKRNRRLKVLVSMVREKLFDGLRAALGEAYSPSVKLEENAQFDGAALIICQSSGVVANREKVSAAIDCILTQIGEGCLTQEDFDRAVEPLRTLLDKQLRDPAFWAASITRLQSDEESLEILRSISDDYASMTYEEVNAIAKEIYGSSKRNFLFAMPKADEEVKKN
ncbi:MAG: insulinase family protein [Akkermansia sp.]